MTEPRLGIVVPHYNHSRQLAAFWPALAATGLPVVVVDDGSEANHLQRLNELAAANNSLQLLVRASNGGKGSALIDGARHLHSRGFSHCVQIDADGQHAAARIPELIAAARQHPNALISGLPIFGSDVPKSRLYGRKISVFWTRVETLSADIQEPMCGFRVYPLDTFIAVCDGARIGRHMEFDIEIMVRMHWAGVPIHYVPVEVSYPATGDSHFALWRDNIRISMMHTRLCLGMLWRLPRLMTRAIKPRSGAQP